MRITSNKTIAKTMMIPCKALLLLHVYIMNDNNYYTDVHKLRSMPIGKHTGILIDSQAKDKKKIKKFTSENAEDAEGF